MSWTGRVVLAGYALYVALVWILGVSPGEIALPGSESVPVDARVADLHGVTRVDERVLVADVGDGIAVIDTGRGGMDGEVAVVPGVGAAASASATPAGDVLRVLTIAGEQRHVVTVSATDGAATTEDASPDALWVNADGVVQTTAKPARPGSLLLDQGGWPSFVDCTKKPCRESPIQIRADSWPMRALDHVEYLDRIAACTPTEVYLYEGELGAETVVYLGRAPLDAPCDSLAIVDADTVLVAAAEAPPKLVHFTAEAGE